MITEDSDHAELLRGLDNLHRFARSFAAQEPERAMAAIREHARVIAVLLGATRTKLHDGSGNILRASHSTLRHWDVLKMPRSPAPGLQLPCPSAPLFDLHSILDTGELQSSLIMQWIGEGTYDAYVERLRELTAGDQIMFDRAMEVLAFAKVTHETNATGASWSVDDLKPTFRTCSASTTAAPNNAIQATDKEATPEKGE
jgi:hypothetical protein